MKNHANHKRFYTLFPKGNKMKKITFSIAMLFAVTLATQVAIASEEKPMISDEEYDAVLKDQEARIEELDAKRRELKEQFAKVWKDVEQEKELPEKHWYKRSPALNNTIESISKAAGRAGGGILYVNKDGRQCVVPGSCQRGN